VVGPVMWNVIVMLFVQILLCVGFVVLVVGGVVLHARVGVLLPHSCACDVWL